MITSMRISGSQGAVVAGRLTVIGATAAATAGALAQQIRFGEPVLYDDTGRSGYLASGDFDRDAHMDMVVTGGGAINIYFNDGVGQLHAETAIAYRSIWNLAAADMDGDRDLDVVWFDRREDRTYVLSVWYNAGDGRAGETIETPFPGFENVPMVVWDLNADGLNDVVFGAEPATVDAFINGGDRTFALTRIFEYDLPDYTLSSFVPGDFDDDGDADIAATFQYIYDYRYKSVKGTNVSLLMNDRTVPFRLGPEISLPWEQNDVVAWAMAGGDLDGDGDLDAVLAGSPGNDPGPDEFVVLENTEGALYPADTYRLSEGWPESVDLADVDTDGRLDVVFATGTIRGVYVLRNLGGLEFAGMSPFPSGIYGSSMNVAELNGDGQFDLVQAGTEGFAVLVNETAIHGPRLDVSRLVRGQVATFTVREAAPGERVTLLYSLGGAGRTRGRQFLGGITLDLRQPITECATATAGSDGSVIVRRRIPANAPLEPIVFQAVIRRGPGGADSVKTPFASVLVED
ncbi:MAG: VCBS repeat-containing protein [Phycisphaerales bacterium]|nr:VCBS repeat-containing protein [Phycisphaerales bacterium]